MRKDIYLFSQYRRFVTLTTTKYKVTYLFLYLLNEQKHVKSSNPPPPLFYYLLAECGYQEEILIPETSHPYVSGNVSQFEYHNSLEVKTKQLVKH